MKFSVLSFQFVDDGPGMSFGSGSDCPQGSQMSCDRYITRELSARGFALYNMNNSYQPGRLIQARTTTGLY